VTNINYVEVGPSTFTNVRLIHFNWSRYDQELVPIDYIPNISIYESETCTIRRAGNLAGIWTNPPEWNLYAYDTCGCVSEMGLKLFRFD